MQTAAPFSFCTLSVEPNAVDMDRLENLGDYTAAELRHALRKLERRLGTSTERAGDFERARSLAHEINNRAQQDYLRAMLAAANALTDLPLGRQLVA